MELSLYIHVPFCGSRCPYCDFAFVVRRTALAPRYTDAVLRELAARMPSDVSRIRTVYFGGGTPSEMPPEHLGRILSRVADAWPLDPEAEVTVEANPDDASRFAELRRLGANRLSLGVQALDDAQLKALGRRHDARRAENAYRAARNAGFDNVSLDLIFGAPGQTVASWSETLDRALSWEPEHLSVYGLTLEPGTAFHRRRMKGTLLLPGEEPEADMYALALDRLSEAGYRQYEVSNFARQGRESRHNLAYWHRAPYLGLGLSAHSFLNGRRSWNTAELEAYMSGVEARGTAVAGEEAIDEDSRFVEEVLLGLRMPAGVPESLIRDHGRPGDLDRLAGAQLLERVDGRVRLTRRGLLLADSVCAELVGGA